MTTNAVAGEASGVELLEILFENFMFNIFSEL